MAISKFQEDLNIIQALDTYPNDTDGLSADELKERFDRAGNLLKTFLNEVLIPELLAQNIPFSPTDAVGADSIQSAIENVQAQISNVTLNMIPDRTITRDKLAKSLDDLLSELVNTTASQGNAIDALGGEKADSAIANVVTLPASGWTGTKAPYEYAASVTGVTAATNVAVFYADTISDAAREQALQKNVKVSSAADGIVTFRADSVPKLDIPVAILILG